MNATDKKPWEKYTPEIAESDDLKPWEQYTPAAEKKSDVGNGLDIGTPTSRSGFAPFQSPVDTKTPLPLQRPQPYVKPAVKPRTIPEAVEDDNNYLGAVWNQVVNSGSDFVGGMTRLIAKNSPVPGLSGAADVLGEKVESTLGQLKANADEEKIQQGFDLTNGISMDDAKALPLLISRFAADVGLAIPTAGASFIAQGYNQGLKEYDTATQGKETDANTRELFGATYGVINGLADRVSLGFLTKNNPVAKSVKKAILTETISALTKKTGKITADVIEETASQVARKSFSKLKSVGVKGLTSAGVEGGTEGLQGAGTDALKLLTNKLSDQEVFNKEEVVENFLKNRINDIGAGGVLGGIAGAGMRGIQSSNDVIATRVAEATTPTEIEAIKAEIADSSLDPERATALIEWVDKFAEATAKLPSTLTAAQRKKAIEAIVERDQVNEAIAAQAEQTAAVDEALAPQAAQETAILEAKKQSLNDNIVEITTEQKFKYFKDPEKDKWYKQLGEDGIVEEITEQQYRLEKQTAPKEVDTTPEALTKAETDLETLKRVSDKVRKYDASLKRLTEAKNAGTITENEFNDMKSRFDDVMGSSAPTREIVTPNIEIDAIQEQTTNEIPLQPEAAVSAEVAEGVPAAGLEVVTEQSETLPQGQREVVGNGEEVELGTLYHGSKNDFDNFDSDKIGTATDSGWFGKGFYFHSDKDTAKAYGDKVKEVAVKLKNPIVLPADYSGRFLYDLLGEKAGLDKSFREQSAMNIIREITPDKFTNIAKELGYDGVIVNSVQGTKQVVVFDSKSITPPTQQPSALSNAFDLIEAAKRTKKTEKGKMEVGELAIAELGDVGKKAIFIDNNFKDIVSRIKGLKDQKGEPFVKIDCS